VKNSGFDLCPVTVKFHCSSQTPQTEVENAMEGKENEDNMREKRRCGCDATYEASTYLLNGV